MKIEKKNPQYENFKNWKKFIYTENIKKNFGDSMMILILRDSVDMNGYVMLRSLGNCIMDTA